MLYRDTRERNTSSMEFTLTASDCDFKNCILTDYTHATHRIYTYA